MAMEKTFNAAEAEPRLYEAWEQAGAFKAGANAKPGAKPFSIMIPPPNVTGSLHMGHAFNNTLQDILIRWKRMQGFDTLWQPGTDHAGIATQMVTEREMAAGGEPPRREMGRDAFVNRVWQQKVKSRGTIIGQLKRLGASCDWSREAFTMGGASGDPDKDSGAPNFHDAVIKVFVEMYNKGLIYRGKRLVNWDPHFETAISDLEVENIDTPGHMWHFKYPLAGGATYTYVEKDEDGNVTLTEERDYISIATTRPETMLGDGAVAVHPTDERYASIVGKLVEIPVGPKEHRRLIPIITDEYPDKDFGSGAVKITGAHDFNDYQVAKRGGIPMYRLMDTRGHMRADGAPYAEAATIAMSVAQGEQTLTENEADAINLVPDDLRGLDRFEARKLVVDQITAEGLAVMTTATQKDDEGNEIEVTVPYVENKPIMQPFGDRSKVVIEPMLTDQWFVDAEKIVGPALDAVKDGRVKIMPESGEKVYYHWLENIEPWCISRQLWWGHQIPVWYGPKLRDPEETSIWKGKKYKDLPREHSLGYENPTENASAEQIAFCGATKESVREAAAKYYAKVGYTADEIVFSEDIIGDSPLGAYSDRPQLTRDPDVLDTWFSSGLWPIGTLGWPEETEELKRYFPTSTLVTGQDILFFWVARMMMMQLAVVDEIPFDTVYLHGLVRDAKGKKMSKSLGNVVDPLDIIDEYGTDALRFSSAAMASLGGTLKLDTSRIQGYRNFGTKLWNSVAFALDHKGAYEAGMPSATPPKATAAVNKWIIGETARVVEVVDAAFAQYRFNDAALALYAFTRGKLCDWYIELSKPLLDGEDEALKAETKATLAWTIDQALILLHPIMPFITEELWTLTGERSKMLIHADWPTLSTDLIDPDADRELNWVISLIDGIRSARSQVHVPAGLKIPMVCQSLDAAGQAALERNEAMIFKLARVDSLTQSDTLPKGSITVAVEGGTFALPLADIIDIDAEKSRLEKSIQKLEKELGGLRGRLNNPKFVASAPDEVVAEARENLALREDEASKLQAALDRLAEIG
ncbi:valine--tRNA ligase [Roseovarius sp. EL26]|uniref:valine--tRNA ligase n=1 Tax=Roseovarius sp. EL26 TaxID=2126672 RepID=UPI000EA2B879|nr:valine--tRNA ligase [Roseovarius sp. EL26]